MAERNGVVRRRGIAAPPVSPQGASLYGKERQSLFGQYSDTRGLLTTQKAQILAAFRTQQAALAQQRQQGLSDTENSAIERGVLGSSGDYKARIAVAANESAQLADAMSQRNQALLANLAQRMQAGRDYETGLFNIQAAKTAEQANAEAAQLAANGFMLPDAGGAGGGGGGGGGRGADGNAPSVSPKQARMRALTTRLHSLGQAYGMAAPGNRQDFLGDIVQRWQARNRLRRALGLAPLSQAVLQQFLSRYAAADTIPGGIA